ncbi:MAG TPA: error-prone DNA polymerase, partial [Solirubrobacteraceae bacterium]|nr:error-prone DNA polymerase [Solirubrobacteraceae bacterium]
FAGFGFPKAHSAAFGLLAYQSTWLRVHYGPEFLCALLNEQPMGFYAPDSLVHEAEGRGITVLPVDVNASSVECGVEDGGVRLGLGYIKGAAAADVRALVAERRRGGPFRSAGELAARCGAARPTLERLAWAGACDGIVAGHAVAVADTSRARRRLALWQMGIAAPGRAAADGTQLALPLELPPAPRLRPLSRWQKLLADYASTGVTVGDHVMAALRPRLTVHRLATSAQLARLPQGCAVSVAGLVIARQRPGTARGTMFLLFEDEWGTINLIVPRAVYERHRPLARAEPLLLAHGRLERSTGETVRRLSEAAAGRAREGGAGAGRAGEGDAGVGRAGEAERVPPVVNVVVHELLALERFVALEDAPAPAQVHRLPQQPRAADADGADAHDPAAVGAGLRAVVPPVQSFAAGRRR